MLDRPEIRLAAYATCDSAFFVEIAGGALPVNTLGTLHLRLDGSVTLAITGESDRDFASLPDVIGFLRLAYC
jgi:hypothetical protein